MVLDSQDDQKYKCSVENDVNVCFQTSDCSCCPRRRKLKEYLHPHRYPILCLHSSEGKQFKLSYEVISLERITMDLALTSILFEVYTQNDEENDRKYG